MKYLVIILLTAFSFSVKSQSIYTPMTAGGYQMKYLKTDSGFALPFRDTTIGRGVDRPGVMVIGIKDTLPYYYNGIRWKPVYVDSLGIIHLIDSKTDSVTVSGNNIFYWSGGVSYGQPLNKLDSIHISNDSIFACIAGSCSFSFTVGSDSTAYSSLVQASDSLSVGIKDKKGRQSNIVVLGADGGSTGVSGGIQSIQQGAGITVDNTNPSSPIVSTSKPIRPYKVYTAILFDTATAGAPTLIPLENTLGCTVSISYTGVGWYTVTLSQPLMTNYSTVVYCQNTGYSPMTLLEYDQSDVSHFYLHVRLTDGTPVDNQCNGAMVEIRIY
jgi:hypothetical protein